MRFKWECPLDYVENDGEIQSVFQQIIKRRNYSTEFLESNYSKLPDYRLLKDVDKAADRIIKAMAHKEKIMIFGHDDLDGITATYILFDYLEKVGYQNHFYFIPNRKTDKHGIQPVLINKLINEDYKLLITVDGGISDFDAVQDLQDHGIDTIITDHHIVQDKIPVACAIVNSKQKDCNYPFDELAGVAVSYFLVKTIEESLTIKSPKSYIFWVALGTISDKVPLVGVNRIIVKKALDEWLFFDDLNIKVLFKYLKFARNYTQKMGVIKNLIKLFSNGRLPDGENKTLNFLLSSENRKSEILDEFENEISKQNYVISKAVNFFENTKKQTFDSCYLYFDKENKIPTEVLGLVASYIVNYYKIPALILKEKKDVITCEARSTDGFNLVDSFRACSDCLIQYGGHAKAAGFTCMPSQVTSFEKAFLTYVKSKKEEIDKSRIIEVDVVLGMDQINELYDYMETEYHFLQPYGEGNLYPVFLLKGYELDNGKLNVYGTDELVEKDKEMFDIVVRNNGSGFLLLDYK